MAFKALTVNTPPAQAAHILAEDDAAIYGGLLGQDCVLPIGQKLKATVISNNKVRLADGAVSVGGHIGRVISGDYEDMTIANGVSGKKRNDIIAARFIAGASGGSDTYKLVVIQGAAGTTAADPTYIKGDLYSGDKQRDYPLWRIKIEGLSIVKVEQMYTIGVSDAELLSRMTDINKSLLAKIDALNSALTDEEFQVIYQGKNDVYCYAKLKNGYATIKGESYDGLKIPSGSYYDLTTLPEKYRPNGTSHFSVNALGGNAKIFGAVHSNGKISLYSDAETGYWAYCFTYPI